MTESFTHPLTATGRRRFTGAEVQRMVEAGILQDSEHVELLNGDLVVTPPQGPIHASLVERLADALREIYRSGYRVRTAMPIVASDGSQPEPDVALIRGSWELRHPRCDEAALLVEVAYSSHKIDHDKRADYAEGGAPIYWILDVPARQLEVYTDPVPSERRYRTCQVFSAADEVGLPGMEVRWRVASLLP